MINSKVNSCFNDSLYFSSLGQPFWPLHNHPLPLYTHKAELTELASLAKLIPLGEKIGKDSAYAIYKHYPLPLYTQKNQKNLLK